MGILSAKDWPDFVSKWASLGCCKCFSALRALDDDLEEEPRPKKNSRETKRKNKNPFPVYKTLLLGEGRRLFLRLDLPLPFFFDLLQLSLGDSLIRAKQKKPASALRSGGCVLYPQKKLTRAPCHIKCELEKAYGTRTPSAVILETTGNYEGTPAK